MAPGPIRPKALGEVAIHCADIAAMRDFYRDIVGLELLRDIRGGICFFRIGPGYGGHTTVLALFSAGVGRPGADPLTTPPPETGLRSSLHHMALSLDYAEQDAAIAWLASQGVAYRIEIFDWIGWRGVFFEDPEGNMIEFVAADPSLLTAKTASAD